MAAVAPGVQPDDRENIFEPYVRVGDDTIVVTFYNAPHAERLRKHYENLPQTLARENIDPRVPWLYGFKLDFRFK